MVKRFALGLVAAIALGSAPVAALPDGPQVVHGQATVNANGQTMTIQQATQQAIVNWNGFSINTSELVRFVQPSQLSAILNRVTGVEPSVINGILEGNGQVFLVNPNGVLIGPGGTVNAGSFMASTLDVSNEDFLSGNMTFNQDPNKDLAAIVNQGRIEVTDGGFITLVAPSISNEGFIIARGGEVTLGTGTQATVNFDGRELVSFATSQTEAGTLVMSQAQSQNILAQVVNNSGVEEAGTLASSGTIEADGVLFQTTGNLNLPGTTRGTDITGNAAGNADLGNQFALDGANIDISAQGDITFNTLLAESVPHTDITPQTTSPLPADGGTVRLSAGGSIAAVEGGGGIGANVVDLTASTGSISTPVFADSVTARAPNGSVNLSMSPGIIEGDTVVGVNGTTVSVQAGADVSIGSVNTVYVQQISGQNVSVTSQTGSIVDAGDTAGADNRDIVSTGDARLSAGEFLGTVDNPLEVDVGGDLEVLAQRDVDGVSGVINGFVGDEYIQDSLTAGNVILNFTSGGETGIQQAQAGLMDNANTAPGDDDPGGATIPSLFFANLTVATDESQWMDLLRGTVVWEDADDEAEEL